jgi:hypothetical protein
VIPFVLFFAAVGVVVARRQPGNPIGWILVIFVVLIELSTDGGYYAVAAFSPSHRGLPLAPVAVLLKPLWVPAAALFPLVILLFPDGRLTSRRWRRAAGERREQLKWLAWGSLIALVCAVVGSTANSAAVSAVILGAAALPVSIGIGILKYRLYEIDRIISRTLAYAIITGLLVGVYARLVLLTTQVFRVHTPVAVAASTLAAASFNPVRARVQDAVDRRFNRARYDADQTVAAFAARLKDTVDLDSVRDDLARVVHQALEPAHVSLWINQRD